MTDPIAITQALEPCPFCGSAAEMEPWHGGAPTKQLISCSSETCEVGPGVTGETPAEAIALWNTRHASTEALQARVAELEAAGEVLFAELDCLHDILPQWREYEGDLAGVKSALSEWKSARAALGGERA